MSWLSFSFCMLFPLSKASNIVRFNASKLLFFNHIPTRLDKNNIDNLTMVRLILFLPNYKFSKNIWSCYCFINNLRNIGDIKILLFRIVLKKQIYDEVFYENL
jgi:hypothetical protein